MPATKNVIVDTIKKFDLKPGEPMKNIFGGVIENSRVISKHAFVHTDEDSKLIQIVANNVITGDEEKMTFTLEEAQHLGAFANGVILTAFGPATHFTMEGIAAVNALVKRGKIGK